jgi:uncharacterized integral membrane protein
VPDLSHLWQRFVVASALIFGLLIGVAATVFGYSNTATVTVGWSVYRIQGIPLWTVAIVPVVLVLVAGTLYHWWNGLHHFTEHMRHRRRVHELEAEVTSLRAHLDQLLEMPDHTSSKGMPKPAPIDASPKLAEPAKTTAIETPALPEAPASNGIDRTPKKNGSRKRVSITTASEPEPATVVTEGEKARDSSEESHSEG